MIVSAPITRVMQKYLLTKLRHYIISVFQKHSFSLPPSESPFKVKSGRSATPPRLPFPYFPRGLMGVQTDNDSHL